MRVLMSRPDHFEIAYEINPWMKIENQARTKRAMNQWIKLYEHYLYLGVQVDVVEQPPGLPDFVFTANGGLVFHRKVILPTFNPVQRHPEMPFFKKWFEANGFETLHTRHFFEGEGDALFYGDTLCLGHGMRSALDSHTEIQKLLNIPILSLQLVDPRYYHLDTCFAPLGDYAVYYPPAFSPESCTKIQTLVPPDKLIELSEKEAAYFAANCLLVGDRVVSSCPLKTFEHKLLAAGLNNDAFELDEFMKAGGSAKCLTLKLDTP